MIRGVIAILWATALSAQWMMPAGPKPNLTAAAPKTADGKPDLNGVWLPEDQRFFMNLTTGLKPEDIPLQPWARALQKQREDNVHMDDPLARCLPHGVPRINTNGMYPFKIVQTPALIVILYEQLSQFRQVFLDGRRPIADPNPSWLGYSVGRWDGDSLLIETTGFNDKTWLDTEKGHPATEALKVTERFRRTNYGTLEVSSTIDDPKAYTRPWNTTVQRSRLQLDTDLLEFICNENEKDLPHLVGK
jgi:hypothetical protein